MISSPFGGIDGIDAAALRAIFDRLDFAFEGKRVLDIGCGRGFAEEIVRQAGGEYFGVDLLTSRAGFPQSRGDAAALPFKEGAFDALMCIDSFEHVPEPERAVAEFRRVLRPGGAMFLSAPNYGNVAGCVKWFAERTGRYEKNTWAPFGRWQPQEWETFLTARKVRTLFEGAGFSLGARFGHAREAGLGLFPWMDHPKMPEALRFRMQRVSGAVGPGIVSVWPGASLHLFWKWEA